MKNENNVKKQLRLYITLIEPREVKQVETMGHYNNRLARIEFFFLMFYLLFSQGRF